MANDERCDTCNKESDVELTNKMVMCDRCFEKIAQKSHNR